jgi:hypothetical protein
MGKYSWNWLPAKGTAGGILVGISKDVFDICRCDIHTFSVVVFIKISLIMWFGDLFQFMVQLMRNINLNL